MSTRRAAVVIQRLERMGRKAVRDAYGPRYGISANVAYGVPMAALQKLAKELGTDHELAQGLWASGCYEARMLATLIDDPALVTSAQMERWCKDFDNWAASPSSGRAVRGFSTLRSSRRRSRRRRRSGGGEGEAACRGRRGGGLPSPARKSQRGPTGVLSVAGRCPRWAICDTACFKLFDRTPHAFEKVVAWSKRRAEFEKRAAFALLASLALHDKLASDDAFLRHMPRIEAAADDARNFVKKGVSWALRSIGTRSQALHVAALALSKRLASSTDSAPRWIGKDVLRDLSRPLVAKRVAAKARRRE